MHKLFLDRSLFVALSIVMPFLFSPSISSAEDENGNKKHAEAGLEGEDDSGEQHTSDEHHATGAPLDWQRDLAIWSFVVFVIFVAVLGKFAWKPLISGLDKREAGIRKDIDDAEQARVKAETMLVQHAEKLDKVQDEVREIVAEARRDADHTKQEIISEAQKEAEATKVRSIAEIERARDAALKDLFDVMAAQVANATEHVLSRSLNDEDQNRLIEEALSQFPRN